MATATKKNTPTRKGGRASVGEQAAAKKQASRRLAAVPASTNGHMSAEHKAALAEGREQGHAIDRYLRALAESKTKRGRRKTKEAVEQQLNVAKRGILNADPLKRVQLVQERLNLEAELAAWDGNQVDLTKLEEGFVAVVRAYSARKGISRQAWVEGAGVPVEVLKRGGVT